MIEFTFYSTKPEDHDAKSGGCKVATQWVDNPERGAGNEDAVIETTKEAKLPVGTYVAVQSDTRGPGFDIVGWLVEVVVQTSPSIWVLQ